MEAFLVSKQMTRETSAPYSQHQNSVEQDAKTVCKRVSAILKLEPAVAIACGLEPSPLYRMRKNLNGLPGA